MAYAAMRPPLGNQIGRLPFIKPTHSKRAGGNPYTPISSRSPLLTTICRPSSSTASEKVSDSVSPSRRDSMLLTEKQNLDMRIPPMRTSPLMDFADAQKRLEDPARLTRADPPIAQERCREKTGEQRNRWSCEALPERAS